MDKTKKNFSLQIISKEMHIYLVSESSQNTESSASLQSENLESRWDDHLLLLVIWRRNSLECLETLESLLSSLSFVRSHAPDGSPEDLGGGSEVESSTAGLHVASLSQKVQILQLVTVEVS